MTVTKFITVKFGGAYDRLVFPINTESLAIIDAIRKAAGYDIGHINGYKDKVVFPTERRVEVKVEEMTELVSEAAYKNILAAEKVEKVEKTEVALDTFLTTEDDAKVIASAHANL